MQARCPAPIPTRSSAPWHHSWPNDAAPGPNLDDLHEVVRFFDRHLRGIDNGWDDEPPVVWFEREFAPPVPFPAAAARSMARGHAYPHPATEVRGWAFGDGTLGSAADAADGVDRFTHRPTTGTRGTAVVGSRRRHPTGSPATCAATRTPVRRTPPHH